jgi:uncharacterized protein with PIN domain
MGAASIEFIDQLNDFLPKKEREQTILYEFIGDPSIKHLVEAMGIPHTEIGQILVNEHSTNFKYKVQHGDAVTVYPASPQLDHLSGLFHDGGLTIEPRFILDNHLGKLTTYLRILGFDAIYQNDYQDVQLAQIAVEQNRIILTRDRQLLMRKSIIYGYAIRSLIPEEQTAEVIDRFGLTPYIDPFHRCLRCNTPLEPVSKTKIIHRLEPKTKKYFHEFRICPNCDRIYWKGSHYDRMVRLISRLGGYQ